ncbi:hypothetical protein R3P38DRAFT_2947939 [Favolaschia claudopus]|uniref:Uncharacterized protein n=1 Tax=Favolaschia claudopus TaxID=2862362 RepID=A0AAW0BJ77_9AGAR
MFNLIKVFAVLALFDEVRDLTFPSESVGLQWEDLAELFVRIATDAMFLPRLESLDVLQYDDVIPYEEMVQMLCARRFDRGSKPKLASFQFIRSVPVEEDPHIYTSDFLHYIRHNSDTVPDTAIVDQLQALIADGLKLRILSWHMSEPLFYTETLSS